MATIVETIEVGVPVRSAYDQWTQFEEFPRFMEGVREVKQLDDAHLHWVADLAGHRPEWDAEIVEQEPDRRIAWRSVAGARNDGVVAFEPLDDSATRIDVVIEFEPEGVEERVGQALGLARRRIKRDMERFKDLVESRQSATGGWRGAVHDGAPGELAPGAAESPDEAAIGPESYSESTRLPSLSRLRGMTLSNIEGEKIGTVRDVYLDANAAVVRYLAVSTGWLSRGTHVVPIDDVAYIDGDDESHVVAPYTADQVRNAPSLDGDAELTYEREQAIYDYYDRTGYWDERRAAVRARQTPPAPTPRIAEAEVADAISRGDDPTGVRVKRWGV
jgi:sporulation protein YlmC with PRC-barrel domain